MLGVCSVLTLDSCKEYHFYGFAEFAEANMRDASPLLAHLCARKRPSKPRSIDRVGYACKNLSRMLWCGCALHDHPNDAEVRMICQQQQWMLLDDAHWKSNNHIQEVLEAGGYTSNRPREEVIVVTMRKFNAHLDGLLKDGCT